MQTVNEQEANRLNWVHCLNTLMSAKRLLESFHGGDITWMDSAINVAADGASMKPNNEIDALKKEIEMLKESRDAALAQEQAIRNELNRLREELKRLLPYIGYPA